MKKIYLSFFLALALIVAVGYFGFRNEDNQMVGKNDASIIGADRSEREDTVYPMSSIKVVADKIEVYYFHRSARCHSCKTIGQYVKETMEQKYSEQLKSGMIDFRELNVELPENEIIAEKYKASGSSLFINRIKDGQDNIEQDMNVWRLLGDEGKFKNYLENKINSYLGM